MSAFSRPSSSSQEDYLFRSVSEFNCLARTTAGLRSLYDGIRSGDSQTSLADNSYSNSDGHFVLRQDMILACRYRVISCIETSSQSAVLLEAEDSFSKMMPVVIKVMHTSYFAVGLKEMQTLRKMNSADPREMSHTIRLLNSFTFESHVCLVFPLLNPLPLTTVIARKCLSKDEMLSVVRKISLHLLSALAFLRSRNIIHADVKPENILVHKDGDLEKGVTLIDFGNAIHRTHQEVSLYYTDFELQTQPYRAPEVHLGHSCGVEVDMWSFGCVLLELLTGQSVFAGTDRADSLQKMTAVLGLLPTDMCERGKFYADLASVLPVVSSSQKVESGALRLMSAFPCIRNYDFASFLSGLLTYQPDKRLTPWEALQHPFMAPLICIPYFLSDTTIDTGVIKKSDYNFRQNISSNRHHLHPSTFDLLHAGTSDWPLIEHANVPLLGPFGLISRPRKDVISQQKCDKRSPIMQDKGAECTVFPKMTAYRTEKCVSSDRSIKRELPHQRNTITQELHQPSVSDQEATLLIDRVKEDHTNSSFSMYKSKSQRGVLEIGQSQKVNSSGKSTSTCTTGIQSASVGSNSHQGTLTGLANDDHKAGESLLMHTAGSFSANSQSCHFQESQLSRTDNHCEISEGANICVKSEGSNTCMKSEGANTCMKLEGSNTCVKSEGSNTCMKSEGSNICMKSEGSNTCMESEGAGSVIASTRLKSDSVAKIDSASRRDTTLAISASISESHLTTESVKYKLFLRSKKNGSQVSSKVVTQDMGLQMLPLKNYPITHNVCVPKVTEHNSSIKRCNYRDNMESCPLGQGVSDTSATLQKHLIVQSHCWQEPQQVNKEPAVEKSVHETVCVKNVADCDTGNQLTNFFQTGKNGDIINQQNYLHCQTLNKVTLSSPGRGRDKESRQSQLGIATIVKAEECVETPVMTESDIYCKNHFEMHDQVVRNLDRTKGIDTSQQCLEKDQLYVIISSSKNESKKGCSLLDTTYECAHIEEKQSNNSMVVSNSPNEMKLSLPSKMYVDKDINNCSHGPYTQEQRHFNELNEVAQHIHNNAQTGKIVRDLSGVLITSRVIDKTWKGSPLYNLNSSSTCATTDNQTGGPVSEPDNCYELVFVSREKSENEDTPRKELVMQPRNVIKSVQVPFSKTQEMQSKTKRQVLSRKATSDYLYIKDAYRAIHDSQSEVGIMKRQPQRRSMGQIDSPNTLFTHKYPVGSRNCVSSTLETVSTQNTYNIRCRDPCQILEPGSSVLKLPSPETKYVEISENSGAIHDAANYREDPNLNVSFQTKDSLRGTRKRRCVQETDYFNQAGRHFQKKNSQKELIFLTGSINAQEDSKTKKLKIDVLKPNVQSKSQTVHGELFHTHCQKDSETLQNDNAAKHKIKTQFTADVRNVSKICNVSGISKSRMTKKGSTFPRHHNNPVLKAKIKSGLVNKSLYHGINNSQVRQQVNVNEQSSNSSRQFRAKTVKRALSFNTKSSSQITDNGKFTVINQKAASWTLGFRTPSLITDNGSTHFGKENDYYKNHNDYSTRSNKSTNSKCMHLSPPLADLNSSDPYEFKVTPVKLPQKSNVNNLKQTKTACQRRSKLRSKTNKKRNNRQLAAAKSVVCSTLSISIRDLVEQKSKYLFQGINKVLPLTTVVHNTPQKNEGNDKKHLLTSGVQINIRNQCKTIRKTELPGTETDVLMSENRLIKTSPPQRGQSREVFENLPKDESKLSSVLNYSSSSKDTPLVKVLVPKNNSVAAEDKTHFQSVATGEINTVLGTLQFEKKLPGNEQFIQNNEADELPVNCTSFLPHHMTMDDYTSPGYDCSTVDFTQKSQKVSEISDNCNDEESSTDEEVLLLD